MVGGVFLRGIARLVQFRIALETQFKKSVRDMRHADEAAGLEARAFQPISAKSNFRLYPSLPSVAVLFDL